MARLKIPGDLAEWNEAGEGYLPGTLGMEIIHVGDDAVRIRMAVHGGRTTRVWDADVSIEGGDKTIARFSCTQLILR